MEFSLPLFLSRLEFRKAVFWALFFFWFSSMISLTLWKILFISLLMTPLSAIPSVIPQIGKQQPLHPLQIWIKSQVGPTLGTCLSILTNLTLSLCLSKRTIWNRTLTPIYFLNNRLEEVLSLKLLGLTICHDLSLESHISKLASKASRRLGILRHAKSFLGPSENLTTHKAFIRSLMEYCSPLWAGAPASHLSWPHALETKTFRIIGISRNEAESLGLSLSHRSQVCGLSAFYRLLSGLPPSLLCLRHVPPIFPQGVQGPPE